MDSRKNLDLLLGVSILLSVGLLLFEFYIWLIIPAALILAGIFSKKFTATASGTLRSIGSIFSVLITKVFLSTLFFLILLPIAVAQGLISRH